MLQVQSLMNTYENHLVVDVQSYQRCFSRQSYCNDQRKFSSKFSTFAKIMVPWVPETFLARFPVSVKSL